MGEPEGHARKIRTKEGAEEGSERDAFLEEDTLDGEAAANHGSRRNCDSLHRGTEDEEHAVDAETANHAARRLTARYRGHDHPT